MDVKGQGHSSVQVWGSKGIHTKTEALKSIFWFAFPLDQLVDQNVEPAVDFAGGGGVGGGGGVLKNWLMTGLNHCVELRQKNKERNKKKQMNWLS